MSKKPIIICLCGKAGVGKDTVADTLLYAGCNTIALADRLKDSVASIFDPFIGDSELYESGGREKMVNFGDNQLPVRRVLTKLGDAYRGIWEDCFCHAAYHYIMTNPWNDFDKHGVVITDVRFRNEFVYFRSKGAKMVRIKRDLPNSKVYQHQSEVDLDGWPDSMYDFVIENNGSLEALETKVLEMYDLFVGHTKRE